MDDAVIQTERDNREQILEAAARLFMARGFANVSIRDLCEAALVTPPTIYHYFGSKEGLFEAVIRKRLDLSGFRQILSTVVAQNPTPAARLAAFIRCYLTRFPRDFFNPGMFLQQSTQISGFSYTQVASELEAIEALALEILEEGIQSQVFRPVSPLQARRYLMNLLLAYIIGEVHYNQRFDVGETADFILDMMIQGLELKK